MFLLLSILASSSINVVFRYFPKYQIDNQQAISANYWTCVFTGLLTAGYDPSSVFAHYSAPWGPYTIALGALFVTIFFGMAITAQKCGISVSVVAAKMGVIFPVLFAVYFLNEHVSVNVWIGIVLSLISVLMVSVKKQGQIAMESRVWLILLPLIVFTGSGIIDTSLKVIETQIGAISPAIPTILIFFAAAVIGLMLTLFRLLTGKTVWSWRSIFGGVILGIPNYFSIYFLLRALQAPGLLTAQVYPINNIGVVVASTLASILLFREQINRLNKFGIATAIVAIILISL